MISLHTFLRRLRRTAIRPQVADDSTPQSDHVRGSNVIPLRTKTVRQKPQADDTCPPTAADYEAVSRLQDPEYGYEFETWRLW